MLRNTFKGVHKMFNQIHELSKESLGKLMKSLTPMNPCKTNLKSLGDLKSILNGVYAILKGVYGFIGKALEFFRELKACLRKSLKLLRNY